MPTRCAPLGIVLPQGADYMVDPPPATSNLSQTEWLHKRHPSEYVPHSITSALLREQSHRGAGYPTSCITSCRLGQELLLFSAAGPARDLVSLTQVPSTTWSPSRPANPDELTYRPHYARLATPVLQLALNSRASQGWERVLRHPNLPILAARSLGGVDFFQLAKDHPGNIVSTSDEEVGGVPWRLNSLGRSSAAGAIPPARTHCLDGSRKSKYEAAVPSVEDFAWGRLLTQRGAMLRSDGAVLEVVLDPGHSVPSVTPAWLPTGHAADVLANGATTSNGNSRITSEFAHSGQMRCTFLANHPRHMVLCLKTRLALVDLRGPAAEPSPLQDIYTCAPGQWLTAVAAPDSCDGALAGYQHCLAAATATQVLLFDVRRPQQVLASWDHTMGPMNVNTSKHSSIAAVKSAGVDTLAFLPPIHPESASSEGSSGQHSDGQALLRLLASNARLGTGVVCEWTAQRAQRGGLAAREGMVWEVGPGEASAVVASGHAAFAWEPSCWTDITPRNPPLLLYSKEYPPALTAVIAYGQEVQRHRRQRQQRAAAGGDGGSASRPVNLLPSTWRPPVALGATVATLEWGTGVAVPRPVLAILKPTQEVVLAALDDANCSGGPRHEGHGSEVVAPAVLAVIEPRGEMEGGDCAAVNAAKDAEMAKLAAVVTGNASQPAFQVKKRELLRVYFLVAILTALVHSEI